MPKLSYPGRLPKPQLNHLLLLIAGITFWILNLLDLSPRPKAQTYTQAHQPQVLGSINQVYPTEQSPSPNLNPNQSIVRAPSPTPSPQGQTTANSPDSSLSQSASPTSTPTQTQTPVPTPTPASPTSPSPSTQQDSKIDYIMDKINEFRKSQGLSSVSTNSHTCNFAKTRAGEISANFNHDGFTNRLNSNTLPYPRFSLVTENIEMNPDYTTVVHLWINSESHKENMLKETPYVCVWQNGDYYAYEGWKP